MRRHHLGHHHLLTKTSATEHKHHFIAPVNPSQHSMWTTLTTIEEKDLPRDKAIFHSNPLPTPPEAEERRASSTWQRELRVGHFGGCCACGRNGQPQQWRCLLSSPFGIIPAAWKITVVDNNNLSSPRRHRRWLQRFYKACRSSHGAAQFTGGINLY